jgi:hypothetical protein
MCKPPNETEAQWYARERARITNGEKMTKLFDCKRGLAGSFIKDGDDPARVALSPIRYGSRVDEEYLRVCSEVMHEVPYVPK